MHLSIEKKSLLWASDNQDAAPGATGALVQIRSAGNLQGRLLARSTPCVVCATRCGLLGTGTRGRYPTSLRQRVTAPMPTSSAAYPARIKPPAHQVRPSYPPAEMAV